jgi:hypothetical protein
LFLWEKKDGVKAAVEDGPCTKDSFRAQEGSVIDGNVIFVGGPLPIISTIAVFVKKQARS